MKIRDMQLTDIRKICKEHYNDKKCHNCPLARYRTSEKGQVELFCHGYLYAFYLDSVETIKNRNLPPENKLEILETLEKDYLETLELEIEL